MSGTRVFSLKPEIKISAAEAVVLTDAYKKIRRKEMAIGFIVQEIAQEAVEAAVARFTMLNDRS